MQELGESWQTEEGTDQTEAVIELLSFMSCNELMNSLAPVPQRYTARLACALKNTHKHPLCHVNSLALLQCPMFRKAAHFGCWRHSDTAGAFGNEVKCEGNVLIWKYNHLPVFIVDSYSPSKYDNIPVEQRVQGVSLWALHLPVVFQVFSTF